ncbi:DUF2470 domain-containing protein [Pseudonocardia bannensis]|uniref:DUF2470 domain-containing protein n=1 Tax=Pseudonocardia bannensis TaxID=630973 RepID=A0A848DMN7_9PSEU|nr:DUF2470 domain-containing protein [Pseudonocardia bannensis]NMH94002.1 DUF2470 domain-containing protein [Pseudonocardia bannensis]
MGTTRLRRPPAPTDAERARSVATRGGTAALVGTGSPRPVVPLVHHLLADGSAVLLLDDDAPVLEQLRTSESGELPVMLELTDHAPVDLREPVRGLLWITGWLRVPDAGSARRTALQVADVRPHPRLLDLGHGATLARLDPGSAVLADAEGTASLAPIDLAAARPDPFCRMEHRWLSHLEEAHPDVFTALARHLPPTLRATPGARVRPLGIDRFGLRLRVETPTGDHDVRLAWPSEATTVPELRTQLGLLVGCPFRAAGEARSVEEQDSA